MKKEILAKIIEHALGLASDDVRKEVEEALRAEKTDWLEAKKRFEEMTSWLSRTDIETFNAPQELRQWALDNIPVKLNAESWRDKVKQIVAQTLAKMPNMPALSELTWVNCQAVTPEPSMARYAETGTLKTGKSCLFDVDGETLIHLKADRGDKPTEFTIKGSLITNRREDNELLSQAQVILVRIEGFTAELENADADGYFEFPQCPAGEYAMMVVFGKKVIAIPSSFVIEAD